ncbi:MAG: ABC transporter permease subunit [Planctomycetia bacterium]|nr:ABC transporter permease subunit [Planctomycetia bacterium]
MFIGPVFTREITIAPRRDRTFIARSVYGGLLLLLICTAWLVMTGTQLITDVGDFSRFGITLFRILAPLQLIVMLFFSAILSAAAVAQEKDRKTLLLLLLTHLSNSELVLGKLLASLLEVLVFLIISLPILMMTSLLGGISYSQIVRVLLVTLFSMLLCGSVGSCVALWRDKTFQAIAATVLILVCWLGFWQIVGYGFLGKSWGNYSTETIATSMSPWKAVFVAAQPAIESENLLGRLLPTFSLFEPIFGFLTVFAFLTILVNGIAIAMVRYWNPSRELKQGTPEEDTWRKEAIQARLDREAAERQSASQGVVVASNPYESLEHNLFAVESEHPDLVQSDPANSTESPDSISCLKSTSVEENNFDQEKKESHSGFGKNPMDPSISAAPGKVRHVWDNPIIWREICTRAYGKKTFIIRLVYFLLFLISAYAIHLTYVAHTIPTLGQIAAPLVPLLILSMVLLNAQAITSLTSERDGGTFTLLLVSDISPKEFVYGKLGGTFYNMKEVVLFPLLLCLYISFMGGLSLWNAFFLFVGLSVLYFFVAMIGVHIGMQYDNTKNAVATSLGIIFFLFVGIATCMWIMIAFSGSFEAQLQPFLAFMIGGGIGLYICLGSRNPSSAIALASFCCPLATFYAITSLLLGQTQLVFISVVSAYLFTSIAMLIPAIDEFDVATGRTTAD